MARAPTSSPSNQSLPSTASVACMRLRRTIIAALLRLCSTGAVLHGELGRYVAGYRRARHSFRSTAVRVNCFSTGWTSGAGRSATAICVLVAIAADVGGERRQERFDARGEAAERGPLPCPEQHAGQFAALVEDRAAGVALPGFDVELDHFAREVELRRVVGGAAAGGDAVLALAVAVDREQVARLRRDGGDFDRLDRRPPDHQRREVPVGVDFQRPGVRAEAARENDFDRALRIADDVPIGDHQAELLADVDQRAAAVGGRAALRAR